MDKPFIVAAIPASNEEKTIAIAVFNFNTFADSMYIHGESI